MESIGDKLKEKRLELNYSLDDMSVKTKLSKVQLKAIEEGNIAFFEDDLSYLTYFVRYYANALGINYEELRRELDATISGYTQTLSISKMKDIDRIDQSVAQRRGPQARRKVAVHKKDLAAIGMIALALAILIGLGFVFVKVIIPSFQKNPGDVVERPIPPNKEEPGKTPETPGETPETPGETPETPGETPETPEPSENLTITKVEGRDVYDITGWQENEDILFEMDIKISTTLRFTLDGAVQTTPESGVVYNAGDTIPFTTKAVADKVLDISIGYPLNNGITINGTSVALDASVTGSKSAKTVTFRFIGE